MGSDSHPLFGELSPDWRAMTLGQICEKSGGYIQTGPFGSQLHASDYVDIGIPSIMPVNIGDNRIVADGIARIRQCDAERLARHRVRPGNIVFSRRGDVERRALVRREQNGWLCGTGCLKLDLGQGVVDPVFASYYLGHPDVGAWLVGHAVGSTMPNLNTKIMAALPFVLPPLDEQKAIARVLGVLDDKIELNRRMNQTLEALARALFKSWFVDFDPVVAKAAGKKPVGMSAQTAALFPDRFQDSALGPIPKGWRVGSLAEIGHVNLRTRGRDYGHKTIEYIDIASVTVGKLDATSPYDVGDAPSRAQRLVAHHDTLWSCVRPNRKSYLFVHRPAPNVVASTGFAVLTAKNGSPIFLHLWTTTDDFVDYLTANAEGSAYPAVRPEAFARANGVIPSPAVLLRFEDTMCPLFERIGENERQSRTLAVLRDALLPQLMSGELRVKQAEKLAEEAV